MIDHAAQALLEIGVHLAFAVPFIEIFERIVEGRGHLLHLLILGEEQRQLLAEHQGTGRHRGDKVKALVHQLREIGDVGLLHAGHGLHVAQFHLGHAAATSVFRHAHHKAIVLQHLHQIFRHLRLVVIGIAGEEHRHLAPGAPGRLALAVSAEIGLQALFRRFRRKGRNPGLVIDGKGALQRPAQRADAVGGIHSLRDQRPGEELAHQIGAGEHLVAQLRAVLLVSEGLALQHQVRKVDVPRMRRRVGALGHEAQVAEVAFVHDLPVILLVHAVDFHGGRFIDEIEQRGKGVAQVHAAPAAMTQVEDALHLLQQRLLVIEGGVPPFHRMTLRRLQIAFADAFGGCLFLAHRPAPDRLPMRPVR